MMKSMYTGVSGVKANQTKLDYLMKKARKKGIALDMINELYIKNNKAQ